MSIGERPGVYTAYQVSGVLWSGESSGVAGVAAAAGSAETDRVYTITAYADAVSTFGADSAMTALIEILLKNGVAAVKAAPVDGEGYASAFALLAAEEDIKAVICDSAAPTVHALLRESILTADQRCANRIGIVESTGEASALIAAAKNINSERMVMVAPAALTAAGGTGRTGLLAAAFAGAVLSEQDPAVPMNGVELLGISGLSAAYSDGDIDLLVRGGVTPLESSGGSVTVVRAVTTRTLTNGAADQTWRELTTVRIIDNVIPAVRDALKSGFSRAKNTAQTRGAIRTRVIIELEKKLKAEIIDGYDNVTVTQSEEDPTVCLVAFDFTVAHGLNQIRLTAYITV